MNTVWHYNFGWLYTGSINAKVKIASKNRAQHAFVKSVGMSAVDIRYWILVLVMAPCFCRRCSRNWLLWRKCKLHFSHWKAKCSNIISPSLSILDLSKGFETYMVGLFSCVYAQVALQRLQVTEAGSTDLTWIWLLTRMDQHMSAEMSNLENNQKDSIFSFFLISVKKDII